MNQKKKKVIIFSLLIGMLLLLVIFSNVLVPYDPYEQNLSEALQSPSMKHFMGTDRYGRDLFSRVLIGGRTTIFSSMFVVTVISFIGTLVGMFSGYFGGKWDSIMMRIADVFLAFPGMVFAIAVAGVLGGGINNAIIALAGISWPKYARIARSQVLTIKKRPYIQAAKLAGSSHGAILFIEILPNMINMILITAILDIGTMMMEIAGLSFLGLGAKPPIPEWGSMMSNGRSMLQTAPWTILAPGFAIFITVVLFHLLGDAIRDFLDPK